MANHEFPDIPDPLPTDPNALDPAGPRAVRVEGRGISSPSVRSVVSREGLLIRIDDELNPETWLNLQVTLARLVTYFVDALPYLTAEQRNTVALMMHEWE